MASDQKESTIACCACETEQNPAPQYLCGVVHSDTEQHVIVRRCADVDEEWGSFTLKLCPDCFGKLDKEGVLTLTRKRFSRIEGQQGPLDREFNAVRRTRACSSVDKDYEATLGAGVRSLAR